MPPSRPAVLNGKFTLWLVSMIFFIGQVAIIFCLREAYRLNGVVERLEGERYWVQKTADKLEARFEQYELRLIRLERGMHAPTSLP